MEFDLRFGVGIERCEIKNTNLYVYTCMEQQIGKNISYFKVLLDIGEGF